MSKETDINNINENIANLKEQIELAGKYKLDSCGFKVGDYVEYLNPSKPENGVFRGYIKNLYISSFGTNEGNLYMSIKGPKTSYIDWTGNGISVLEGDFKYVSKIENPIDLDNLNNLSDLIYRKEKEIKEATTLLQQQLRDLKKEKELEESKCLHKFIKGNETGETIKHLLGKSEIHEYECSWCGKIVESC